ncbi:hypothetical protein BC829DRAFT_35270 [Chytridium lagenaria]|nr:hypothetical protein BC829DRAFT_35270 [Chytridium lagenaria]
MASRSQIKKGLALHGLVDYLVQMERGKPVPAGQACTVISALSQSGKFRMAKNLAEHIIKTNSPKKMDGVTKCVSQLILDCMARRKVEYARDLMAALKAKGMSAETRVYTQMLNSHLMAGKLGDAASVLKDIKKVSGELGLDTMAS